MKKDISKYITPQNIIIGIIVVVFVFLVILIGRNVIKKDNINPITKDQIMIQKGGNTVIVNKNGLIEYRSENEVFYRTWEMDRINSFFSSMQAKAREYLANPPPEDEKCRFYTVTLYIDDEIVTVCIEEDEDLDEIYEEYENDDDETSLSDYFDDEDEDDNNGNGDSSGGEEDDDEEEQGGDLSPTTTPAGDGGGGGDDDGFVPPQSVCEQWADEIFGDTAIISNVLCTRGGED